MVRPVSVALLAMGLLGCAARANEQGAHKRLLGPPPGESGDAAAAGSGYGLGLSRRAHTFGDRPSDRYRIPVDVAIEHPLPPPSSDMLYRRPRQGPNTRL